MTNRTLIIGTRGSKLALWQANYIKDRLAGIGVQSELKIIKTQGDIIQHLRLDKLEGKGFFTKELEEELLRGDIDLAVHSHKDLPTQNPPGLIIAAVTEREDPAELLIIRKESVDLHNGLSVKTDAVIGTSSNRRKAQIAALRPDFEFRDLRGNVITRVEKLRKGDYDAIVLAKAGITRIAMDLSDMHVEEIAPFVVVPAPAQGVLALQTRETDQELINILSKIHNKKTADTIGVERSVLKLFEAGCHAPLGCYCREKGEGFEAWTSKADTSDEFPDRFYLYADTVDGLADRIARQFDKTRKLPASIFISREVQSSSYFARAMAKHHIAIDARSFIQVRSINASLDADQLKKVDWVFFTSKNSVLHFFQLNPVLSDKTRFAVIGRGSEEVLRQYGYVPAFSGENEGIEMEEVALRFAKMASGTKVLIPRAKDTLGTMKKPLTEIADVIDIPVYETVLLKELASSEAEVLIFTSPSNVEAYFAYNKLAAGQQIICIGHASARKVSEFGFEYTLPATPDEIGLAEAVFGL